MHNLRFLILCCVLQLLPTIAQDNNWQSCLFLVPECSDSINYDYFPTNSEECDPTCTDFEEYCGKSEVENPSTQCIALTDENCVQKLIDCHEGATTEKITSEASTTTTSSRTTEEVTTTTSKAETTTTEVTTTTPEITTTTPASSTTSSTSTDTSEPTTTTTTESTSVATTKADTTTTTSTATQTTSTTQKSTTTITDATTTSSATSTQSSSTAAALKAESKDFHAWCCFWAAKGQCLSNPVFMGPVCQKSCGTRACKASRNKSCIPRPAIITASNCPPLKMALKKGARSQPSRMTSKFSSGKCADISVNCAVWATMGECNKNQFWMKINCQKSCHCCGCDYASIAGLRYSNDCRDRVRLCPFWASMGRCDSKPRFMRAMCKAACKICA